MAESPSMTTRFRRLLIPSFNAGVESRVVIFNVDINTGDPVDSCIYSFKQEDILADRVPTIRRVVITYRDLGTTILNVTLGAVNDSGTLVSASTTATIGSTPATGLLKTAFVDVQITGFRPQLTFAVGAGQTQASIVTVLMVGTIERQVTL